MAGLAVDEAAWTGRWRGRSTAEKAVLGVGLLALAVLSPNPASSVIVFVAAVACALLAARIPLASYLRALLAPVVFVALGAAAVAVSIGTPPDDAVWSAGWLSVSSSGTQAAATACARAAASMAALLLLVMTTPVVDLLNGLHRIRVPGVLIEICGLIYRMLFTLLDSFASIREAQAARLGYRDGRTARRSIAMVSAAVLVRAWDRSQRLDAGLAGRGSAAGRPTLTANRPVSIRFVAASVTFLLALAVATFGPAAWPTVVGRG